jgi:predicted O-methyltransferase YrrM
MTGALPSGLGSAERKALRAGFPKARLEARHTAHGRLLPNRRALLQHVSRGGVIAEVGVADGNFAAEILASCAPRRLILIDKWEVERFRDGRARVEERFAAEIGSGQVEIRQGASLEMLAALPPGELDLIYIDTDHSYATTRAELELAARAVRPDGRIAGHDFCVGNIEAPVVYGTIPAAHDFCVSSDWGYEFLTLESEGHFSFCLRRLSAMGSPLETPVATG